MLALCADHRLMRILVCLSADMVFGVLSGVPKVNMITQRVLRARGGCASKKDYARLRVNNGD